MHTIKLRQVGGSVMFPVPKALLESLGLGAGSVLGLSVTPDGLLASPRPRPRYTLAELLAECDPAAEPAPDDGWLSDPPVGREEL